MDVEKLLAERKVDKTNFHAISWSMLMDLFEAALAQDREEREACTCGKGYDPECPSSHNAPNTLSADLVRLRDEIVTQICDRPEYQPDDQVRWGMILAIREVEAAVDAALKERGTQP